MDGRKLGWLRLMKMGIWNGTKHMEEQVRDAYSLVETSDGGYALAGYTSLGGGD